MCGFGGTNDIETSHINLLETMSLRTPSYYSHSKSASYALDSGRKVLISLKSAKIYSYTPKSPSRVALADSTYSLKRVESLDSIRSNISEILSAEIDASIRSRVIPGKGRLMAHGIIQIYEIEGGIHYISCGGGSRSTRETFVHPLLPKLKIFRVDKITFILMLAHPERFWRIHFTDPEPEPIDQLELIFRKLCSFVDLGERPNSQDEVQSKAPEVKEAPKQSVLAPPQPVKKGKLNRLSKLFKGKKRTDDIEDLDGSPMSASPQRTCLIENSSLRNPLKANLTENSSVVALDYNSIIDKLIEQKVEENLKKKELGKSREDASVKSEDSSESILYKIIEEQQQNTRELENPQYLTDLTEQLNNDVGAEIFQKKRSSVYSSINIKEKRSSLYEKNPNAWMDVEKKVEEYNEDEHLELLMMVKPSLDNLVSRKADRFDGYYKPRARVQYQPHRAEETRLQISGRTYRRKREDERSYYSLRMSVFGGDRQEGNPRARINSSEIFSIIMEDESSVKRRGEVVKNEAINSGLFSKVFGW